MEEWNKNGPGEAQQQQWLVSSFIMIYELSPVFRNAKRHLQATVSKFIQDIQRNMGVHMLILTGYKSKDDKIIKSKWVHIVCLQKILMSPNYSDLNHIWIMESLSPRLARIGMMMSGQSGENLSETRRVSYLQITPQFLHSFTFSQRTGFCRGRWVRQCIREWSSWQGLPIWDPYGRKWLAGPSPVWESVPGNQKGHDQKLHYKILSSVSLLHDIFIFNMNI